MVLIVLAMMVAAGLIATTLWWLLRRRRSSSYPAVVAGRSIAAGTLGGMAMVPVGMVLLSAGYEVNKYGELVIRQLLGQFLYSAMAIEHFAISVGMAVPFVAVLARRPMRHPVLLGAGYGAFAWLAVNSLALPLAFGQPTPWQLGIDAIWPSLLVHVVYGLVLGAVVARDTRKYAAPLAHWEGDGRLTAAGSRPPFGHGA